MNNGYIVAYTDQLIPWIASLTFVTTVIPLGSVLGLTAIKDIYDDVVSLITSCVATWSSHLPVLVARTRHTCAEPLLLSTCKNLLAGSVSYLLIYLLHLFVHFLCVYLFFYLFICLFIFFIYSFIHSLIYFFVRSFFFVLSIIAIQFYFNCQRGICLRISKAEWHNIIFTVDHGKK